MTKIFDNHTHTTHSPDSHMNLKDAVETACQLGLSGIAFTDHYDLDPPEGPADFFFDPDEQQKEISSFQGRQNTSGESLLLLRGIEVGIQPGSIEKASEIVKAHPFDTVISSIHFIDGCDPYHGHFYNNYGPHEAYLRYLVCMWECMQKFTDFDILGHYDYIARYSPYKQHSITLHEFGDILSPMLQFLAYNGKTFEINTKSYQAYQYGTPDLDIAILKRFKEYGGDAVSLGSDAHGTERIADKFEYYTQVLQNCGFRYSVHFEKRKPIFERL